MSGEWSDEELGYTHRKWTHEELAALGADFDRRHPRGPRSAWLNAQWEALAEAARRQDALMRARDDAAALNHYPAYRNPAAYLNPAVSETTPFVPEVMVGWDEREREWGRLAGQGSAERAWLLVAKLRQENLELKRQLGQAD